MRCPYCAAAYSLSARMQITLLAHRNHLLNQRPNLFGLRLRCLYTTVLEHGRVKTKEAKAKEVRPLVEKVITVSKKGDLHSRRKAIRLLRNKDISYDLINEIAPRYVDRPGGYTRIMKLGPRPGDAAEMAYLELV